MNANDMQLKNVSTDEVTSDDNILFCIQMKFLWKKSIIRYSDKELLEIFPEAKGVLHTKLEEWISKRNEIVSKIKQELLSIWKLQCNEFDRWFLRTWLKVNEGECLLTANDHILRLKRLIAVSKGKRISTGKGVTEEEIQSALQIPLESLYQGSLKKSGHTLIGLCPFHEEKNASFRIYPDTNSCRCFSCQRGGNSIVYIRLTHNCSFIEAVKTLLHQD